MKNNAALIIGLIMLAWIGWSFYQATSGHNLPF